MAAILVIDDEKDSAGLLKRVLEKAGHRVFTCTDCCKALEKLSLLAPDLIVVNRWPARQADPRPLGLLKQANANVKLLVLTHSAVADNKDLSEADDYLIHPADLATIEMKVHEVLNLRKQDERTPSTLTVNKKTKQDRMEVANETK